MARQPIEALARMRQTAKDEAERDFAASLADEFRTRQLAEAADAQICRERDFATDLAAGDGAVEAYAAWLPTGRKQAQLAWEAHERATASVALARAALTLAHAAAEAVAGYLDRQATAEKLHDDRVLQSALDEIGGRAAYEDRQGEGSPSAGSRPPMPTASGG